MSMRIKAREKNLLLTCRSANKVEQVKTFKNGLRDTTKRKNCLKYQTDETERLESNSRKRSKNIRKSHSEKQMKIPIEESMTIKESTKLGPVSINDSNEENYKNAQNLKRQTQNYPSKYIADNLKKPSHLNEEAIRSKESNQPCDGPDRNGDSAHKVFVSLNFAEKSDTYNKRRKPTNHTKLRRLWKNLQHLSSYHKKQKIGRLRKYCCRKPATVIRRDHEKNGSNRNDLENGKISLRQNKAKQITEINWKESEDESQTHTSNNSKTEHSANKEAPNQVIDEVGSEFSHQNDSYFTNKLTPEDDVSKIDEKYLKYIRLITRAEGVSGLKNNENQENIIKSEDRDEEIVSKDKKSVKVLKVKTSQNQLKIKRIPSNTIKDNQSKEYLTQNKKNLIQESESKPICESIISDQRTKHKKKFIVLKLSSTKQPDRGGKLRIDKEKESGPVTAKEDKNNSKKPNYNNVTPKKNEIVTTAPRGEVSKFEFIEIWRRNSRKESQDSLSSHSSTTDLPPDNHERSDEDSSDCEYLGIRSYQALKNIVEQEVLKIFKNYGQKKVLENDRKETESKTTENITSPVPLGKRSGTITVNKAQPENKVQPAEKQVVKDDRSDVKNDRVMQPKINLSPQKEKLPPQNQDLKKQDNECEKLRVITRNNSEEINKKLKILSEQENKDFKIPSDILKNWTIMHRLEKAFLALGNPNFHSKNVPPTKTRVIGGRMTNTHHEKVGADKSKTKTGGASVGDENKTHKPHVDSSKIKISQKKLDTKYSERLETEQKVKKIKSEKETEKGSKKKDGSNVQDLLHSRKSSQPPLTKKPLESSNTRKPEEISLSKDHKTKIKKRYKPESLSRVPQKIFENNDTKPKNKQEKPIQTQEVNLPQKPTSISANPEPIHEEDNKQEEDNDKHEDCKVRFSTDLNESSVLGCNDVNVIEHNLAEEAKLFDSQIEKLFDLKSSRNLLLERQTKIEDESLERKKTFAVFPVTDITLLKPKKSQSCHKLEVNCKTDVKCSSSTINQNCNHEYWDPFEEDNKTSTYEQFSESKDQNYSSKTELFLKTINNDSSRNDDNVFDKTSIYSDEDVTITNLSEFSEVQPNKEKISVEDIPQELLFQRKEINLNERVVKERSILSLIQNLKKTQRKSSSEMINTFPSTEDNRKPHEKTTPDVFLQRIFHTKGSQTNYSNMSAISTATYDVLPESNVDCDYQIQKQIAVSSKLRPAPPTENISTTTFKTVRLSQEIPSTLPKTVQIQPNWERDIKQYRAIVKDIIDQYKRTTGFLKQNEALLNPFAGSKFLEFQGKTPPSSNFRFLDINEYRRKIISEYRDLSIFEYKSKIQETSKPDEKKNERGLAVVKEVTPEMDYDIKDFQPNVKKVLNSQIYVDQNHFYKLKCLRVNPVDQNPSLQVMQRISKLEAQEIKLKEQSKSAFVPKSNVSLPNSKVYSVLFHTPNHSKVEVDNDFTFDDFMSLSEFEETESDFADYH